MAGMREPETSQLNFFCAPARKGASFRPRFDWHTMLATRDGFLLSFDLSG